MKAIVAGTGIDKDRRFYENMSTVETEYGSVEYSVIDGILYLPRHKPGHPLLPHMINYKANVKALKMLGVDEVITVYAVGSITRRLSPGRVQPFDLKLSERIARCAADMSIPLSYGRIVYVTTNGPRFETAAEIEAFRVLGADVVGMTLATEAELLAEQGIRNVAIAYSINWAAGLDAEGFSFLEDESIERIADSIISMSVSALSSEF